MAKSLVIVESPAKAKTINRYLGKDYVVKSSVGHIRDLPTGGATVDPKARAEEEENLAKCEEIVDFLEIGDIKDSPVGKLPYGLQKKVELGRALATEADFLMLDEPMAGMNVEEKREMCRFILKVNDELGTTMVLIEHDMGVVMDISDNVVVLDYGKIIADGPPEEVRANQEVIDAYLGVSHD